MSLLIYSIIFWIPAIISTVLSTNSSININKSLRVFVKTIPALSAAAYVFLYRPTDSIFYILLVVALVFCALGDIGIEITLIAGLGLFLFSHIFYSIDFIWQSLIIGADIISLGVFLICLAVMIVYIFLYSRYLKTTEREVDPVMLKAVNVYAFVISITTSTALLLWLSSGVFLGFLPFFGALFFVASDSAIGIREFHHNIRHEEYFIKLTYYLAIFLLSLSVVIYLF